MTSKSIGDEVNVYNESWIIARILSAEEVEKTFPDKRVGKIMKEKKLSLAILNPKSSTTDLLIARIHSRPNPTSAFVDENDVFCDPGKLISEVS